MTSTITIAPETAFEIFSRTSGHSFGVWEAETPEQAIMQMEDQAGESVDASDLDVVPTAECIRARRERAARFEGVAFFAGMQRRYVARTDELEALRVAVMGSRA